MKITMYKSSLCPRCYLARQALEQLIATDPDIEIEFVDILISPRRTLRDGIRMIPAIKAGEHILRGIYLDKKSIAAFLAAVR